MSDQQKNYPIAILAVILLVFFGEAALFGHKLVCREQMQADQKSYIRGLIEQDMHTRAIIKWGLFPDWRSHDIAYEDGWQPHFPRILVRAETYSSGNEDLTTYRLTTSLAPEPVVIKVKGIPSSFKKPENKVRVIGQPDGFGATNYGTDPIPESRD